MNPARTQAQDRRMSAIHEAGHVVMARHLRRAVGFAFIAPTLGVEPEDQFLSTWHGKAGLADPFGTTASQRRRIGVAGAVAELVWRERRDPDAFYDLGNVAEETLSDPYSMSPSDWQIAGHDFGDDASDALWRDFQHVTKLFRRDGGKLWPDLLDEARRLIVASREPGAAL
jgi:hypothetical protein